MLYYLPTSYIMKIVLINIIITYSNPTSGTNSAFQQPTGTVTITRQYGGYLAGWIMDINGPNGNKHEKYIIGGLASTLLALIVASSILLAG